MKRDRGFSIVEVLVAGAIASVLITVVTALVVMVGRNFREQHQRASLQTDLISAREDMTTRLTGAPIPLLISSGEIVTASFLVSGVPKYSAGQPQWQSYVGYRRYGSNLVRYSKSMTPTVTLPVFPSNLAGLSTTTRQTVARNLSDLTFTVTGNLLEARVTVLQDKTTLEGRYTFMLQEGLL